MVYITWSVGLQDNGIMCKTNVKNFITFDQLTWSKHLQYTVLRPNKTSQAKTFLDSNDQDV